MFDVATPRYYPSVHYARHKRRKRRGRAEDMQQFFERFIQHQLTPLPRLPLLNVHNARCPRDDVAHALPGARPIDADAMPACHPTPLRRRALRSTCRPPEARWPEHTYVPRVQPVDVCAAPADIRCHTVTNRIKRATDSTHNLPAKTCRTRCGAVRAARAAKRRWYSAMAALRLIRSE